MNNFWTWFLLGISIMAISEKSMPTSQQESDVKLVAVSLDARMLGLGPVARVKSVKCGLDCGFRFWDSTLVTC